MSIQSNFPSLKPSLLLDFANTKTLDPKVTFARATDAYYYDGKTTALAEQNVVLQSQNFTNGIWSTQYIDLSANSTTAPDGTTTATTISNNSSGSTYHRIYQPLPGFTQITPYSFSVYLKYKDHQYVSFGLTDNTYYRCQIVVNLVAGTIVQNYTDPTFSSDTLTSTITDVGNGWYRVTGVFTPVAPIVSNLYWLGTLQQTSTFSPTGYVGTGTGFYMWGAQAEQRFASTAYTPTTSLPVTNYIPVLLNAGGKPRFDHNPVTGESLGLLIEETRTNVASYSANLSISSAWPPAGVTTRSNSNIAPDGTLTAISLIPGTSGGDHDLYRAFNLSATTYTASVYAKYSGTHVALSMGNAPSGGAKWVGCIFDLQNGIAKTPQGAQATCTASIQNVGNGWYRCSITFTSTAESWYYIISNTTNVNATMGIYGFINFTGNNWNSVQLWGAQLEQGSFATSYIPTTDASVTRATDYATITGNNFSSWFKPQQGSLYFESSYLKSGTRSPFQFGSSMSNRYSFYTADAALNYYDGTVAFSTPLSSNLSKIACSLVNYDIAVSFNNSTTTAFGAKALTNVDTFTIGAAHYGAEQICGTISKIAYYPQRLSNTQLQALTA
jgi:hypothetical protein